MTFWLALAVVLAAPFVAEALRPAMDDAARKHAPGRFVTLSLGVTHYDWLGPERGPVAVCRGLARSLVAMGYRVLIYDLYGRGYSDRPGGRQNADFFVSQLQDLLASQKITGDITLIGYSMGGSISTAFAARNPSMLRRLILIAPAGMDHAPSRVARFAAAYPVIGDWLMLAFFPRSHRKGTDAERALPSSVEGIADLQQAELRWRGFVPAVLSSLRGMLADLQEAEHREIRARGIPVLAIWGHDDRTIPIRSMGQLALWNREARHEVIQGAGHALAYSHTDAVAAAIRSLSR
jgi:pimeloyl-ACP methyl ester carboxylesterase